MTPASLLVAAALLVWGPVRPAPEPGGEDAVTQPGDAAPTPDATPEMPPPPAPEPPAAVAPPPPPVPIVAKAPLDVRARPVLVAAPRPAPPPQKPLSKQWAFWALAGSAVLGMIIATYVATRPEPQAYRGNTPPYYVPFP